MSQLEIFHNLVNSALFRGFALSIESTHLACAFVVGELYIVVTKHWHELHLVVVGPLDLIIGMGPGVVAVEPADVVAFDICEVDIATTTKTKLSFDGHVTCGIQGACFVWCLVEKHCHWKCTEHWSLGKTNSPLVVVMGVSGSGKSTLARTLAEELKVEFLDADDFHPPTNIAKMKSGKPLNDKDRRPWLQNLALEMLNRQDKGAILACSALKESYRELLAEYAPLHLVYLKGSYESIYERMKSRKGHFMPPELLQSQFRTLEPPRDAIEIPLEWSAEQAVKHVVQQLR